MIVLEKIEDLQKIKYGDYLIGVEHYGGGYRTMKGLYHGNRVKEGNTFVEIQADDNWKGARGTMLDLEIASICILEPEDVYYSEEFVEKHLK